MKKANYLIIGILLLSSQYIVAQKGQSSETDPVQNVLVKDPETNCTYRYYYFPNLYGYYDAKLNNYILKINGEWARVKEIPSGYMGYSLYNKVNVVITDYDEDDVLQFLKAHRKKYPYNFHLKQREVSLAR